LFALRVSLNASNALPAAEAGFAFFDKRRHAVGGTLGENDGSGHGISSGYSEQSKRNAKNTRLMPYHQMRRTWFDRAAAVT